jgi:hypothetical protein
VFDDASTITAIDELERLKAACAAAQVRLTERFVASQSDAAERLRAEAQACSDAGDFDGWVLARDRARSLELETDDSRRDAVGRDKARPSRTSRRMMLSRSSVSAQVGLARHESPNRGSRLASAAVTLVRHLPRTLDALSAGALNERRAELVVRATSHLRPELRARVDDEVVGANFVPDDPRAGIGAWGDRELERRVRACADRLDAAAAVGRCRIAESERRVTIRPVPDTMALVSAVLPVAQAVAVHAALSRAALSAKAAGDQRGKGQVMADTLVELVTGQSRAVAVPVEVQVVITDRALLDGDATAAHVPGYGAVPAGWARELLTRSAPDGWDAARVWVRRLFTHPPSGTLVAMESTRRLFPAGLRRFVVARDGTCRTPWCDAPVAHADHVEPHADGGPTSAGNGQGLCVRCNIVKEQPGWRSVALSCGPLAREGTWPPTSTPLGDDERAHTVQITTPTGHVHLSVAPPVLPGAETAAAPAVAAVPAATAPRPSHGVPRRRRGVRLEVYERDDIEVEYAEAG